MNLYDVNIMELIEQYTAAIREMQQDRMEISSEFIDMAAHLVQMKSALLLPRSPEAERMKAELTGRLIEYSACKEVAAQLGSRARDLYTVAREPMPLVGAAEYTRRHDPNWLVQAWFNLMGRSTRKKKPTQEKFEPLVTAPFVSVASRVSHMLRGLAQGQPAKDGAAVQPRGKPQHQCRHLPGTARTHPRRTRQGRRQRHFAAGPYPPQKKGQNAMTERQELGSLEAMLFAHAEPVETARLADALRLDADETHAFAKLQKRYDEQESGMVILYFEPDRWQMTTRPYYGEMVKRILDTRRNAPLSPAALEVLAVIAYNQPVSRSFIEQVRGVDSSSTVTKLLDKGTDRGGGPSGPARQAGSFPGHGHISARLWPRQSGRPAAASRRGCRERRAGGDGRRRRSAGMEVIAYGYSVVPSPTDRLGAAGGALAAARRPADTAGRSVCVPPGQRAGHWPSTGPLHFTLWPRQGASRKD